MMKEARLPDQIKPPHFINHFFIQAVFMWFYSIVCCATQSEQAHPENSLWDHICRNAHWEAAITVTTNWPQRHAEEPMLVSLSSYFHPALTALHLNFEKTKRVRYLSEELNTYLDCFLFWTRVEH